MWTSQNFGDLDLPSGRYFVILKSLPRLFLRISDLSFSRPWIRHTRKEMRWLSKESRRSLLSLQTMRCVMRMDL